MHGPIKTTLETPRFTVVEQEVTRRDGSSGTLAWIQHPGAVVILPLLDDGSVCLIRSHRLTIDKTILELPAGTREPGEEAIVTAERELQEETGYRAGKLQELAQFYSSPGTSDELMFAYLATDLTPGPPAREPGEQIENHLVPWAEVSGLIERGEIHDAKTLVTLLLYERTR